MSAGDEEPEVDLVHLAKESHAIRTVAGERHVIARLAALEPEVTAMKNILLRIERHMGGSPSPARDAGTTRVSKWNLLAGIVRAVVEHVNANLARAVQVEEYSLTDANAALLIQKICSVSSDIGSVDVRTDTDYPEWARLAACNPSRISEELTSGGTSDNTRMVIFRVLARLRLVSEYLPRSYRVALRSMVCIEEVYISVNWLQVTDDGILVKLPEDSDIKPEVLSQEFCGLKIMNKLNQICVKLTSSIAGTGY